MNSGLSLATQVCVQGSIDFDSTLGNDLHVTAHLSSAAAMPAPLEFKLDTALCTGSAAITPSAAVNLPIYYDPDRTPLFGFDAPCVQIGGAELLYQANCAGIAFAAGERLALGGPDSDCIAAFPTPLAAESSSPSPSVATDGAGHALAVWLQNESSPCGQNLLCDSGQHVVSSYFDGTWSAPAAIGAPGAHIDTPKVVFLSAGSALAVWVQNTQRSTAADRGHTGLYFSLWDGTTWTTAAPITSDALLDVAPSLAGDPSSGHAVLIWLRAHDTPIVGQQPVGVYAARFDGTQWSTPTLIGARSTMLEHAPTVKFDRHGQAVALWMRDVDGDFLTSEDRQIVMAHDEQGTWSTPEALPNLPVGAYLPSFAFDANNDPILAFVVPPSDVKTGRLGSGDGNASVLYAAHRRGMTWESAPVGPEVHAERPIVSVNADNHAILMYRQFGDTGDAHVTGDVAAAVADLNASALQWTTGFLTADGQVNWEVAFDSDANTADNVVFAVKKPSAASVNLPAGRTVGGNVATKTFVDGDTVVASMLVPYQPDLALASTDIAFSNLHPLIGDTVTITANIHNIGLRSVGDAARSGAFTVAFYDDEGLIRRVDVPASTLPFNTTLPVSVPYTISRGGLHTISGVADEGSTVTESDESNNTGTAGLGQPPAPTDVHTAVDTARGSLNLRWQPPDTAGIREYRVYRSTTAGSGYELVGGAVAPTFVDALAERGVTYHYVIAAVDVYGATSPFSSEVAAGIATAACVGDCTHDGAVTVDELLIGVNIALGTLPVSRCTAFDTNADGEVTVDELLTAVNNALGMCTAG